MTALLPIAAVFRSPVALVFQPARSPAQSQPARTDKKVSTTSLVVTLAFTLLTLSLTAAEPTPAELLLRSALQSAPNPTSELRAPSSQLAAPSSQLPAPELQGQTMETLDDKHRLAIGDKLSFRIVEDQEDPTEPRDPKSLVVTDSGDLEVPYLGRFPAETKTCKQLAGELKAALEKDYYYQATVLIAIDLMARSRGKVYLVGPVRVPGPMEIPSDEVLTLSKAIMRAGSFNDFADKHNVKVTRKGATAADKKTILVDVGAILEKGKVELDLPLESGDLILIPERAIRF